MSWGKKKSEMKRKKKQSRGEGVGRKSNLAGKAPWPQSLHTDIFTTVKASFNAGLCKQRDVSAVEKFEADLMYRVSSLSPQQSARTGCWQRQCPQHGSWVAPGGTASGKTHSNEKLGLIWKNSSV